MLPVHRGELLALMLERFDTWLGGDHFTREEGLWRAWNGRLWGRDQRCASRRAREELAATVLGGERDGTLLVRLDDGTVRRVIAGELLP